MKIVIAGGNGFLGKALEKYFIEAGNSVLILTRKPHNNNELYWNGRDYDTWADSLEGSEVLINLAGKSVDCRYNDKNRAEILSSRIDSTRILQKAIDACKNPPKLWLNSSSATIYIHAETQTMTEEDGIIGDDFSMNICKNWETTLFEEPCLKTRKVALRTAIVLGKSGGALPKLKLVTALGLGGQQGNGRQRVSWIHVDDFCRAVDFMITEPDFGNKINLVAPETIDNKDFMKKIRNAMRILFGLPAPAFLLEFTSIFLQTETELLLKSRNVYPQKLLNAGFEFKFQTLDLALKNLL